jgi:replicative DNA helicase
LVVVDYIQLMSCGGGEKTREREVAEVSRGLKLLARELNCPVFGLSQLNRGVEQRQDKRPYMSDLRESGALEQDADSIILLYRDEYYNPDTCSGGIAELSIAKNRHGPTGLVQLAFDSGKTKFSVIDKKVPF